MSGDMDVLVRSLSAVSRLLGSSDLSIHVSMPLINHVRWATQLLIDLGVLKEERVSVRSRDVMSVPCTRCNGTGEWHERGVRATDAKWLRCPRCRGDKREVSDIERFAIMPASGDVDSLVIDYRNEKLECVADAGEFECPSLREVGSAMADMSRFLLRFKNASGGISKEQPYLIDLSARIDFACPDEECKRLGGVFKEHVGLLVGACACWRSGVIDNESIPPELHDWLWFERALHFGMPWNRPPFSVSQFEREKVAHLESHYKNKKIGSWLDGVS